VPYQHNLLKGIHIGLYADDNLMQSII